MVFLWGVSGGQAQWSTGWMRGHKDQPPLLEQEEVFAVQFT